jgi:hypothetical protein
MQSSGPRLAALVLLASGAREEKWFVVAAETNLIPLFTTSTTAISLASNKRSESRSKSEAKWRCASPVPQARNARMVVSAIANSQTPRGSLK